MLIFQSNSSQHLSRVTVVINSNGPLCIQRALRTSSYQLLCDKKQKETTEAEEAQEASTQQELPEELPEEEAVEDLIGDDDLYRYI